MKNHLIKKQRIKIPKLKRINTVGFFTEKFFSLPLLLLSVFPTFLFRIVYILILKIEGFLFGYDTAVVAGSNLFL